SGKVPGDGPQASKTGRAASEIDEQSFESIEDATRCRTKYLPYDRIECRRLDERLEGFDAVFSLAAVGEPQTVALDRLDLAEEPEEGLDAVVFRDRSMADVVTNR